LKIFIDDDDDDDVDDDDVDDDDDDVERTRTGPSAVRSDLEHQVNHDAKIFNFFYHFFRSYEEGGPTGAGKTRCLAVTLFSKPKLADSKSSKERSRESEFLMTSEASSPCNLDSEWCLLMLTDTRCCQDHS